MKIPKRNPNKVYLIMYDEPVLGMKRVANQWPRLIIYAGAIAFVVPVWDLQ